VTLVVSRASNRFSEDQVDFIMDNVYFLVSTSMLETPGNNVFSLCLNGVGITALDRGPELG